MERLHCLIFLFKFVMKLSKFFFNQLQLKTKLQLCAQKTNNDLL